MYERHQQYFAEAKKMGINEWCNLHRQPAPFEKQRDINLFIARYSSDLEVVITCDGCQEKIKGNRFVVLLKNIFVNREFKQTLLGDARRCTAS